MIAHLLHTLLMVTALSTPCADEGANNCYWDASTSGNNVGHSYIVLADETTACIYYPNYPQDDYCEEVR